VAINTPNVMSATAMPTAVNTATMMVSRFISGLLRRR
jgi:hypothetical protein